MSLVFRFEELNLEEIKLLSFLKLGAWLLFDRSLELKRLFFGFLRLFDRLADFKISSFSWVLKLENKKLNSSPA